MYGDDIILFNINNLITENIENRIKKESSIVNKTKLLLDLIDYNSSSVFSFDEKKEIENFYISTTNEGYDTPYLDSDTKDFIMQYAAAVGNLDRIKHLINECCFNCEEAVCNAQQEMEQIKAENSVKIYDDINLELIDKDIDILKNEDKKPKKSLKSLLLAAKEKASENK